MDIRFDDQVVLVTGASTGIGAALAKAYAASGASVAIGYNQSEHEAKSVLAEIEAAGGKAILVRGNVAEIAQAPAIVEAVIAHYGRIDILVNNAGALVRREAVATMPDDVYQYIMDVNMTSAFAMSRAVIPHMQKQGHGNILNMTSISGRNGGGGNSVIYASSKAAVATFTRGLAKELAPYHIRVNAIAPGVILTPFHDRFTSPELMANLVQTIPMKRAGSAEECVGAAFFLTHDALSSYVTGQIIDVNGGQLTP